MTPSPQLIDRLLTGHSAEAALRTLKQTGYSVSIHVLERRVTQMIRSGERKQMKQPDREPFIYSMSEIPKGAALGGSEKLLKACLDLYRRRASEVGVSVQEAMLFMLNAPERLGVEV